MVLTPFMGVGSEVYAAVKKRRKGVGIELKDSYYRQAKMNMESDIDLDVKTGLSAIIPKDTSQTELEF